MTDAGEKLLRQRVLQFAAERFGLGKPFESVAIRLDVIYDLMTEHSRAELERAAGIADISGEPVIAAAIRKLKE